MEAVPYDMPVAGYDCNTVNTLRMWRARSPKDDLDFNAFSNGNYEKALEQDLANIICKVLYPEDNHIEGKRLRLTQHYFFTSATLQYAIKDFKRRFGTRFNLLPDKIAVQINDTHPGLAIPELMRILMDEEGLGWDEAQSIVSRTIAYTNHTVMCEALEKWPEQMVKEQLPRIYMILEELNRRLCERLWNAFPGDWDRIAHMAILAYDQVHMANLCVAMSYAVNGVSKLHGEILKNDTFHDYYTLMPEKFTYITNGITHRRWLMACNTHLRDLITEAIGDKWFREPQRLEELMPFADDKAFREKFQQVKQFNKHQFNRMLQQRQDMTVEEDFMFDAQCKRLHEYKRQLLNALHIHVLYNRIMDDPNYTMVPRVFIFAAKASPGYYKAKLIIRYILALSKLIDQSPRARQMLRIIFVENYDVSAAEAIMPASEVSEQLSTAGKEASGTGNMKFMMNGAVTIGTMDGANVEISEQVGMDNIYIFGMRAETADALTREGTYQPMSIFEHNGEIRRALTQMIDGTVMPDSPTALKDLYHDLLFDDRYFVLKDFGSYSMAQRRINEDYQDRDKWLRMAVINTAKSGVFAADRTIQEYNDKIWHLK